jgi:hypothetical protein
LANGDRLVGAQELTQTIIALSTAYAAMTRELARNEIIRPEDLSEVLIATADSTDGLTRSILRTLGDSLAAGCNPPPADLSIRRKSVH